MKKLFFALCLLFASPTWAAPYFPADTIPPTLIAPPFAQGSAEQKKQIATMIERQRHADPAEVAQAAREFKPLPEMIANLPRADYPAVYALLDRTSETVKAISSNAKDYWQLPRPYIADARVKALIEPHKNFAYPSGHASSSYVWARVMAMLLPEKRAEFMARAAKIADHRVLVGMHYPLDLEGGRELAALVTGALTQNAEFQRDLAAAREELLARQKR